MLWLKETCSNGNLSFSCNLEPAVRDADIIFLALPTPPSEDGSADLSHVLKVSEQLADIIDKYTVVVTKSTVPVGTGDKINALLSKHLDRSLYDVVSIPEFLREGSAVADFMKPDRVVVGTSSRRAQDLMKRLYAPFVRQNNPVICMDIRSSEMTKYAANCYLATRISFMNEIANLCDLVGANVDNIRKGIGSDDRIGKSFLYPGIGYGGSCFPKDVQALERTSREFGYNFRILNSAEEVNRKQRRVLPEAIDQYFGSELRGRQIALWGLAFKPNTDDIREAPALDIINYLLSAGAHVSVFDPEAQENVRAVYGDKLTYCQNQYDALNGADALVIATEWSLFRTPDFARMSMLMQQPVIFDGRNLYDPARVRSEGFVYSSIGRPASETEAITKVFRRSVMAAG